MNYYSKVRLFNSLHNIYYSLKINTELNEKQTTAIKSLKLVSELIGERCKELSLFIKENKDFPWLEIYDHCAKNEKSLVELADCIEYIAKQMN